jgi:shikimate 5-dehydrogenase
MPFKKNFLHPQNPLPAINLIHFQKNFTENTDMLAFQKSFSFLDIQKKESILLLGSGGSAEAVLYLYHQIHQFSILSRNKNKLKEFETRYRIYPLESDKYNVLINCTPIKSDELLEYLAKYRPKKVIDLPYFEKDTSLINFCKNHIIPYVDGRQFWKWQAERQLQYFLETQIWS